MPIGGREEKRTIAMAKDAGSAIAKVSGTEARPERVGRHPPAVTLFLFVEW